MTDITQICEQLKLLAINAAIEDARTGGEGKAYSDLSERYSELITQTTAYRRMLGSASKESVRELTQSLLETRRRIDELAETVSRLTLPAGSM